MTDLENRLLKMAYDAFNDNKPSAVYRYIDNNGENVPLLLKQQVKNSLYMLEQQGYIAIMNGALGYSIFKITSFGRDFIEGNIPKEQPSQIVNHGDQNITIIGSNNVASHNFNQLIQDISSSDIPDEYTELLETLIYEIQNPRLNKNSKKEKIENFLIEILGKDVPKAALKLLTLILKNQFIQ